jgi:hypothetical protein
MKKWYVVVDSWAREENYDNAIWTVSDKPDEPGWETDSGYPSYGLLKAEAEELANAANEAPELRAENARLRAEIEALLDRAEWLAGERAWFSDHMHIANGQVQQESDRAERAEAEIARLREVLKFYACDCGGEFCEVHNTDSVACGGKARAALAEQEEK